MDQDIIILRWLFIGSGLLLSALAVPLLFDKIPPNPLYGVRLSATLNDRDTWYRVNRYVARWLLASGLATVIAAVILERLNLSVDLYAILVLVVTVSIMVVGTPAMIRSARKKD